MDRKARFSCSGAIMRGISAWLLSVLVLLPAAALLSSRLLLNDEQLTWISAAVLAVSSAAAGAVFLITAKEKASRTVLLILCMAGPVLSLLLGLCIDGRSMSPASAGRVLLCGLLGFLLCLPLRQGMKRVKGKKRFKSGAG